ncbi:hypothetical protein BDN70DRAFT_880165 [Pholiota conissans]|uniref:Zn(2)-C6 fungal-type domain-containing protein n=1 Tax=Pholiota conissans TaxID=109636 RepID=A0A9P5YYV3_9AGAR|nr:hypothetical protein BDN70DRAFT_880165 [Pholiota conissans]
MPASPPYDRRLNGPNGSDSPTKKRRKGATRLSCAECRRLKLRCDRAIPCSSCVKRGCGAICPDGSLTTGQGNRFVLASTQELHEKISELANRVRELEDALRASHQHLSSEQHPLLSDDLLKIKAPLQRDVNNNKPNTSVVVKEEETNPDVVDAFGTLSIAMSGKTKYFGHTANSWYFLQNELPEEDEPDDHLAALQNVLPPEILSRAASFPIAPFSLSGNVGLQTLYWYLPPAELALELRSIYFTHAAWMYNPISVDSFDSEVYSSFYNQNVGQLQDDPLLAHRLSLMFMILAIGSLMNTSIPSYNVDAEKYHQLARAALFHHSFFDNPTINAVQALFLMTFYLFLVDRHGTNSGARWAMMGLAVKVGQSIGLHRDSGKWKVDPVETTRRRELFWELFTYDSWQCWTYGRPPSFFPPHFDCKMPYLEDNSDEHSFHAWKHRYSLECMTLLHDQAFGAKMPTYATVLQLDRKLRAFPVPPVLQVAGFGSSEPRQGGYPETIALTLQRHIVLAIREMNLLYLHRSFFARAISDHPKDPLGSPYGTSVIAAYRSAGSLVAMMRNLHTQLKEPSERIWFLWTHMFSCAIVLGSIVTRCPSMSLAPSALVQLDSACELFSKAARGFRANKVLNIMLHLQEKAHFSLEEFRRGKDSPLLPRNPSGPTSADGEDDELSVLGGKTRLVSKREPSSPILMERSPISQNPIVPLPLSPGVHNQLSASVLEYLRSFGPSGQHSDNLYAQQHSASSTHTSFQNGAGSSPTQYSDSEMSPSMYGMSTMPSSFHSEPSSYMPSHQPMQSMLQSGSGSSSNVKDTQSSFPQYFPVYDYGPSSVNFSTSSSSYASNDHTPMLDSNPMPGGHRRSSGSPDGNMQSTWLDFVNTMAMQP